MSQPLSKSRVHPQSDPRCELMPLYVHKKLSNCRHEWLSYSVTLETHGDEKTIQTVYNRIKIVNGNKMHFRFEYESTKRYYSAVCKCTRGHHHTCEIILISSENRSNEKKTMDHSVRLGFIVLFQIVGTIFTSNLSFNRTRILFFYVLGIRLCVKWRIILTPWLFRV